MSSINIRNGNVVLPDGLYSGDIEIKDGRISAIESCCSGDNKIDALRNSVRIMGKDIVTASRLCSASPAKLLGLNKGEIAVGMDADLIILDKDLELLYTICGGRVIYSRE